MPLAPSTTLLQRAEALSFALMTLLLAVILTHGLVPAAFFGMLVYTIVRLAARPIEARLSAGWSRLIAVAAIAIVIVTALVAGVSGLVQSLLHADWAALVERLHGALDTLRTQLPQSMASALPEDASASVDRLSGLLQNHAATLSQVGLAGLRATTLCLITGIIAGMLAVEGVGVGESPLGAAIGRRIYRLWDAFRKILFAQAKISVVNTVLTALYLAVALPIAGVHMPHAGLLVVLTFFAAFIPVIGNLLSNGAIVLISFTLSVEVATASLAFLLVIHQLEYFLNARMVGNEVDCKAWELLCVMLVAEALFGASGVVAAPILYSWAKVELGELFRAEGPLSE